MHKANSLADYRPSQLPLTASPCKSSNLPSTDQLMDNFDTFFGHADVVQPQTKRVLDEPLHYSQLAAIGLKDNALIWSKEHKVLEMTPRTTTATIVAAAILRAWLGAWF